MRREFVPFINLENPLYFRPNLMSIFTYQNGLKSKKLFSEMFLNFFLIFHLRQNSLILLRISSCPNIQVLDYILDSGFKLCNGPWLCWWTLDFMMPEIIYYLCVKYKINILTELKSPKG